jgi:tetratricopeptide (TPR) repeat protein
MKKLLLLTVGLSLAVVNLGAQPKPKSQKEAEAIMAIFNAADPDARIAAAENLLTKFADTEFKGTALLVAAQSAQEKNDFEKMVIYAERALEADPKAYQAMLMLATGFAQRTRENDLDKEDKLKSAEKHANDAIEILKTAPKPRPDLADEQWDGAKKDFTAQAHEALGMAASVRKKWDVAAGHFKTAMETGATPDNTTKVRLASAYNQMQKYDEAIALLDQVLADQNLHPAVRQFAGQEKLKAATGKVKK